VKMLYKPLSLVVSVLGGILAAAVFKKVWAAVSGEEEAPKATSSEYSTREVLIAAAVQGAIYAGVKAAVDRAGAKGIKRITGVDPGR
jgi:head-tail adaptor